MLIEFLVSNYRSIKGEARFSLVAGTGNEHRETNVVVPELTAGVRSTPLLRSAAIYGANAAGKSNLIQAMAVMREIVIGSSEKGERNLPVVPFKFDVDSRTLPTTLRATFLADGVRYEYGFSVTSEAVLEEWLYAWPHGRAQLWFTRDRDETDQDKFDFGKKLTGDKEVWRRATRTDALFLSTAVALNSAQLRPVSNWFTELLCFPGRREAWSAIYSTTRWDLAATMSNCEGARKAEILEFLQAADLAVSDLRVVERESKYTLFRSFRTSDDDSTGPDTLSEPTTSKLKIREVNIVHEPETGQPGELAVSEESDGTQKFLSIAGPWLDALANGKIIFYDELHDNLHPALVRFLVECFHDPKLNTSGAQLIFSTHETSILTQEIFRRDQVWFCERGSDLVTSVFALTQFSPRKGLDNLKRSYLGGRYGALPIIRALSPLSESQIGQ